MTRDRELSWTQLLTIVAIACVLGFGYFQAVERWLP